MSEKTPASSDIVIVGAGIIGLSIAWQIARRSSLRVVVLERGAGVGEGSTGASSAVCRFRYSHDEVVSLAKDGIHAYQHWSAFTGLKEVRADYRRDGVLWIPGPDPAWADQQHARMRSLGIRSEVLEARDVRQRFPSLNTCMLAPDMETGAPHDCNDADGRFFLELDGGHVDPVSAASDLLEACRLGGVAVAFKAPVASIETVSGRVCGVRLRDGRRIQAPLVINAAGPWCRDLYEMAGVPLIWNLSPTRIQVLHRDRPQELTGDIPVTVDMPGGIYFRTQNRGQQLIVSSVLEEDERDAVSDPDDFQRDTDADFEAIKLHALHHRLPALKYEGRVMGYCGLYTVNLDDVHPVLGPSSLEGFWVANGFSGHGFKLAPAIGSMVAQAITGESMDFDTSVQLSFLSFDRAPISLESKSVLA